MQDEGLEADANVLDRDVIFRWLPRIIVRGLRLEAVEDLLQHLRRFCFLLRRFIIHRRMRNALCDERLACHRFLDVKIGILPEKLPMFHQGIMQHNVFVVRQPKQLPCFLMLRHCEVRERAYRTVGEA